MASWPVVFYNVQRLLRPTGGRIARALDVTSEAGWTRTAYRHKVANLGACLASASRGVVPAVLVLTEVDGETSMNDVIEAAGWAGLLLPVSDPSEQVDGWDVGIAYNPAVFEGGVQACSSYVFNNRFATRDLLTVRLLRNGRPYVVAGTHWPSRKISGTEPLRIAAGAYCDHVVEGVLKFAKADLFDPTGRVRMPSVARMRERWSTPVLFAGDFNDEPWDVSVRAVRFSTAYLSPVMREPRLPTGVTQRSAASYLSLRPRLYNPTWSMAHSGGNEGTYLYGDDWYRLDQMLLSRGMLDGSGLKALPGSLRVHAPVTARRQDGTDVEVTRRGAPVGFDKVTHQGASDHLPLVMDFAE